MVRAIILGPQCVGKTTLAQELKRRKPAFFVLDEDDEINKRNAGKSPSNWTEWDYKWNKLRPEIARDVLEMNNIVFLVSFFDYDLLLSAKKKGFMVISLTADFPILEDRNATRMKEGRDDAHFGWEINLPYHEEIRQKKLADAIIDTSRPVEETADTVLGTIATQTRVDIVNERMKESQA